jgi:hypothetical protein
MAIEKIDSAGAGIASTNHSTPSTAIIDSTRPDFVPNQTPDQGQGQLSEAKGKDVELNSNNVKAPKLEDIAKEVRNTKVTEQDSLNAAKSFKLLLNTQLKPFDVKSFMPGTMLFYRYDAKNKENTYDKSPLVFVLRKSRGYMLGLNLHWCPIPLRLILINFVLKANRQNIRSNMPLNISYAMLKPVISKLGLNSVIRLYIFGRISRRGVVVPPEFWTSAAKLKSESFSGGYSADQLYKMSLQKTKEWKGTRRRTDKVR